MYRITQFLSLTYSDLFDFFIYRKILFCQSLELFACKPYCQLSVSEHNLAKLACCLPLEGTDSFSAIFLKLPILQAHFLSLCGRTDCQLAK